MTKGLYLFVFSLCFLGCQPKTSIDDYSSETLRITKLTDNVYEHVSFLQTESFGLVGCNGMVAINQGEAVIFDTPTDDQVSLELIDWVENKLGAKIKAIIPTHFHEDCLGGLDAFHQKGIPSYAHEQTIALAKSEGFNIPENSFNELLTLELGNEKIYAEFFGEGHTPDNVIGYFPAGKAVFGGCMIKSLGANQGYLGDANVNEWPLTVTKLKNKYPDLEMVIPGHGKSGGKDLLDYTIELFQQK